jgi:hypothetical protein
VEHLKREVGHGRARARKETKNLNVVDGSLYRNEYRNHKLAGAIINYYFGYFYFETRSHYVAHIGLELMILQLQPLKFWDYRPYATIPGQQHLYLVIFLEDMSICVLD